MRVCCAQLNLVVGDLSGNEKRIANAMDWAEAQEADVLLLPELAVSGYPPEDLVLRSHFVNENIAVVERLARRAGEAVTVVGFVDHADGPPRGAADAVDRRVANAAAVLHRGHLVGTYHKVLLPNYGVFDEDRTFATGTSGDRLWEIAGVKAGVSVCEDIWVAEGPPKAQALAGAQILLNINASPFHYGKAADREAMLAERARAAGVPVVYVNLVGGQDELVFDGASVVVSADGEVLARAPQFEEAKFVVDVPIAGEVPRQRPAIPEPSVTPLLEPEAEVYTALVTGLRDYVRKNGFSDVVIGLSGGIDSALTAAIATDALGAEAVWGIAMPSRYSSDGSLADAKALAGALGIRFDVVPIDDIFSTYLTALARHFGDEDGGVAPENLQARIRGAILMALSNKHGPMVLATGNKSEMAVGYTTLYGDMAGGYAVLKDVFKTLVFRIAEWRNRNEEVIPRAIIDKPPSAELRPNQLDSDSLPPYEWLDQVLTYYVEYDLSLDSIVDAGYERQEVVRVTRLVDRNEYKRRQAAPGVKITTKAFGKDRRLPITNAWRP